MFNWINAIFTVKIPRILGVLPDNRPPEEKAKDFTFAETVSAPEPVAWKEKTTWRTFPVLNQMTTSSCVAFTTAKILLIILWLKEAVFVKFSPGHIYTRRENKPEEGMSSPDIWKIAQEGVTLDVLVPTEGKTEDQLNNLRVEPYKEDVGKVFKIGNYLIINPVDFETVASVIQKTGKGVMVWFYFLYTEWAVKFPYVSRWISQSGLGVLHHSVAVVDFGMINGKKYLKIEDSAHFGNLNERWISEDFFRQRCYYGAYPMNFKFDPMGTPLRPKYDGSTVSLQNCLKAEGLFPSNVESTGVFGPITSKAVTDFQIKYGLLPSTGKVGPATESKLKLLYP